MDEFGSLLYSTLQSTLNVCRLTNDRKEIVIRCAYCGDSVKSHSSAHFYIQAELPYFGYCQRCGTKSLVSREFLSDFKISDSNLKLAVTKLEKERKYSMAAQKKRGSNKFIDSVLNTNDFTIPIYTGTKGELRRLQYFNDRLGTSLNILEARRLGIILNFKEFIKVNNLVIDKQYVIDKLNTLNKDCIGFLSQDKNFIQFRSLDAEKTGFRYFNYNITGKHDNTRKFFTIKQPLNLMNPRVKIIITEGTFDLFGVYFNIYDGRPPSNENIVFMSTNGIGMNLVINTVCKLGFLDPEVEIYSDDGVSLNMYKGIKHSNPFITQHNKLKIFYNKLSKDVGVPKSEIELKYSYV